MESNSKLKKSLFFSYQINPNIKFETQEEGEEVILLLRSHPFTQINWVFKVFVFVFLLIIANFFIYQFFSFDKIFFINFFSLVFLFSFIFFNIVNWYFNVGILTNKRLIDIDFNPFSYREITSARIENIEDITIKGSGYFGTFFDYGSIYVQTAGMENYIEFHDVPYPSMVVKKINQFLNKKNE